MVQYVTRSNGAYSFGDTKGTPISLDGPTDISLNIRQQDVLKIVRLDDSLVIYLVDGQQVLIDDFFVTPSNSLSNRLFMSTDGEIREVLLEERYGLFNAAEYRPLESYDSQLLFEDSFTQVEPLGASASGRGAVGSVAGAAAGVGLLAMVLGGSSNSDTSDTSDTENQGTPNVDGTSDRGSIDSSSVPAPVIQVASGTEISGTGEPGATVAVDIDGDGTPDLTTTVAANGTWSVSPSPALADGTLVSARQTDPDGNQSVAAGETVDAIAPIAPSLLIASGTQISGTGEPGATVDLDTDGDGIVDLSTTVAPDGTWSVTPSPALSDGVVIAVRQTDPDGNQSVSVGDTIDALPPNAPVIQVASGTEISGTGEPGATVAVDIDGDGTPDLTTTVAANGTWSVSPSPALADVNFVPVTGHWGTWTSSQ